MHYFLDRGFMKADLRITKIKYDNMMETQL